LLQPSAGVHPLLHEVGQMTLPPQEVPVLQVTAQPHEAEQLTLPLQDLLPQ
jgi:hypothetical protein